MSDVKNLCVYILDLNKFYPVVGYMWDGEPEVKIRNNNGLVYISNEDKYYALTWNGENFSIGLEPIEPKKESELFERGGYVQYIDSDYAPENFKYNDHLFNEDRRILQLTKDIILDESNITNYQEAKRLSYTYSIEDDTFKFIEYPEVIYDLNIIVWDTVYDSNFIDSLTPDNNTKFQNTLLQPGEEDYITIKPIKGKYPKETDNCKGIAILGSDGSVLSLALSIEIEPDEKQFKIKFSVPNVINQNCLLFIPENILVPESGEEASLLTAVYEYEEPTPPTPPTPPPAPDPEATIVSYSNQTLLNSSTSKTFDGLISYGSISTNNNNVRRKNDTIFINENSGINQIIIHPVLRTLALFSDNTTRVVIYNNDEYPVSVFIVETITNDYETYTKHHVITYNQNYTLPLDARCKKIQITFKVGEITLYRTIQFYKLPDVLYTKYFGSGGNNQFSTSEYDSIIDALTGNPIISKYGCLLLTNEYDVIETIEVEENNKTVLKGVAELVPTTKVRMGNLNGIYNETFGTNQPRGFGLYGESVYLTGNFYLNNGKSLVDISNDVTLAVGNIARIQNTLNNLDESLHNSIYNLTLALNSNITGVSGDLHQAEHNLQEQITAAEEARTLMAADFKNALIHNTEALFKLGKDYSIWAVGNAGISIINPNVAYNEDGTVKDETVGDGDEFILLLGESVQIANTKVVGTRIRVICSSIDPTGFNYSGTDLFRPTNATFSVGWINQSDVHYFKRDDVVVPISINSDNGLIIGTGDMKPFRYVALLKHTNTNSGLINLLTSGTLITRTNCDVYQFSKYFINETNDNSHPVKIYTQSSGNTELTNYGFFVYDVVTAGMFSGGKFNADLIDASQINVENVVAVLSGYRNENFNPNLDISSSNNPLTSNAPANTPYVVIQGPKGRLTARSGDLIIGTPTSDHIRITDNKINPESDDTNIPGIYIKNTTNDIVTKFSGIGDYTENSSIKLKFEGLENILSSNSAFTHTFDAILKRKLYTFLDDNGSIKVKSINEDGGLQPIVNRFYPGYCTVTITRTGVTGSWLIDDGPITTFGRNRNGLGLVISNIKLWTGNGGEDTILKLYIDQLLSVKIAVSGGQCCADRSNSDLIILNHFYGDNITINLSYSGNNSNIYNTSNTYSGNSSDLFNCDIGSLRYLTNSGSRLFIQNIESFTLNPGKSKMVKLESAKTDINLAFSNSYYYKANESSSTTTVDPSTGNNVLPSKFYTKVELITGFRVSWETSVNVAHYGIRVDDLPHYTTDTTVHHAWLSQEICDISVLENGSIVGTMNKSRELFESGFTNVTNNGTSPITYNIEYAAIIQLSNDYNIEKTQSSLLNSSGSSLPWHNSGSSVVIDDITIGPSHQAIDPSGMYFPVDTVTDSDDLNWETIVDPSYYPAETLNNWNPAIFPTYMNFSQSSIKIYNYDIRVIDNNLITLVQGNGLGVGVNNYNYFVSNLIGTSLQTKLLSNNFGINLDNSGLSKIFNGITLKSSFNILQGKVGTPYTGGRDTSNTHIYNFYGTSLNQNKSLSGLIEQYTCNGSLFKFYGSYRSDSLDLLVNLEYVIRYIKEHDIYIVNYSDKISNTCENMYGTYTTYLFYPDAITVIFGGSWTPIFDKFGHSEYLTCIIVWPIYRKDVYISENYQSFYPTVFSNKLYNNSGSDLLLTKANGNHEHLYVHYYLQVDLNGSISECKDRNDNRYQLPIIGDFGIQILYTPNL